MKDIEELKAEREALDKQIKALDKKIEAMAAASEEDVLAAIASLGEDERWLR